MTEQQPKEWCVDWEVEVEVTLSKRVTHRASEIVEAETAEAAVEKVKDEMWVDSSDLDLSSSIEPDDFDVERPDMSTFKVNGAVTEWN